VCWALRIFLSLHSISYKEFGEALDAFLMDDPHPWAHYWTNTVAGKAVHALYKGINSAADIAREHEMERAFAIAPTASCSYRYLDKAGFTTAPEIAPPIAREVDRDSGTFGVESFNYGNVEIAAEVGWEDYTRVVNGIVNLFETTGLFHGYSFNSWSDVVNYDIKFLKDWLESSQTSLYYSLQVLPDTQRKDDAYAAFRRRFQILCLVSMKTVHREMEESRLVILRQDSARLVRNDERGSLIFFFHCSSND